MRTIQTCWYKDVCTVECSNSCLRFIEMSELMEQSGIPDNKQRPIPLIPDDCDLKAFQELQKIKDNITSFVSSGNSLYLYSANTGNGKTSWSIKLLLKYFDNVWAGNGLKCRGVFVHVPSYLNKIKNFNVKDSEFEEFKYNVQNTDVVVFDDIASTGMSAYDYSQLLGVIDTRIFAEKSNIFTGNLNESGLEKELGKRLTSRIWNSTYRIELKGLDNR